MSLKQIFQKLVKANFSTRSGSFFPNCIKSPVRVAANLGGRQICFPHCKNLNTSSTLVTRSYATAVRTKNEPKEEKKIRFAKTSTLEDSNKRGSSTSEPKIWTPIYKCDHIVLARTVQRFKLFQSAFTVLLVTPISISCYLHELVDVNTMHLTVGASTVACGMLYVVGNFFARFVGFVYINPEENPLKTVRVAHLNFWGGRVDAYLPIKNIVPFSDFVSNYNDPYLKLKQSTDEEESDALNITLRYGTILELEEFEFIFGTIPRS